MRHSRGAGLSRVARVLFRRSLITEQSARELGSAGGSEVALGDAFNLFCSYGGLPGPHCLSSFINGDTTPWVDLSRESGSLKTHF